MSNHTLRTLNVIKEVPGIANKVHVNIAYEVAPGATFSQTREFEIQLEQKIQADLYELGHKPVPKFPDEKIRYIPMVEALEITLHPTAKAFSSWKQRHNSRHPDAKVITRMGLVELNSLRRAIAASANSSKEEAA